MVITLVYVTYKLCPVGHFFLKNFPPEHNRGENNCPTGRNSI